MACVFFNSPSNNAVRHTKAQRKHASNAPQIVVKLHQPPNPIETPEFQTFLLVVVKFLATRYKSAMLLIDLRRLTVSRTATR